MPSILTIDTSASACSIVLDQDGTLSVSTTTEPRAQARKILEMVQQQCADAGISLSRLDAFAVVAGPGSFTGLRIGVGVVQGLALAGNKPVVLLSSLAGLAQSRLDESPAERLLVVLRARDDEVYLGAFDAEAGLVEAAGPEVVVSPAAVALPSHWTRGSPYVGLGDGWVAADALLGVLPTRPASIHAKNDLRMSSICRLARRQFEKGHTVTAEQALPRYLKEQMQYKLAD